jgi:Flp pilus assembly pilin Flp
MPMWPRAFLDDESGQDFVEYTLLMAFMVVVSAALLIYNGDAVAGIWGVTTNNLSAASQTAR